MTLKTEHTWTECIRQVQFPFAESNPPNEFENYLLEGFNFKNAFNKKMVEMLGEGFLESVFCVPVFVGRHRSVQLRSLFDLRHLEKSAQFKDQVKLTRNRIFSPIWMWLSR